MIKTIATACLLSLGAIASAFANDSEAELPAGGLALELRQNDDIEMRQEKLYISLDKVLVDYIFHNHAKTDSKITVAFPMPAVQGYGGDYDSNYAYPFRDGDFPDNFMQFSVQVAGQEITPQLEQRAFLNDTEVTSRLAAAGVPVNPLAKATLAALADLSDKDRIKLTGLIGEDGQPVWEMRATYYWQQTFPAGKDLRVSHSYKPAIGGALLTGTDFKGGADYPPMDLSAYCAEKSFVNAAHKMTGAGATGEGQVVVGRFVTYVLHTGANWRGPIGKFILNVEKPDPKALVSFCGTNVKKVSATRFQMEAVNFTPTEDLHVMWVTPSQGFAPGN